MKFSETKLKGAYIIDPSPIEDERGFFARTFCTKTFAEQGIPFHCAQCNISYNQKQGTLRGMHYQAAPHQEAKLVRCTAGAIFDVILDLRPDSDTFCHWTGVELSAANRRMLYIPEDFAHGFLTLTVDSEVFYQMSYHYVPEAARGLRWDDPAFNIKWPEPVETISPKDQSYPDFKP